MSNCHIEIKIKTQSLTLHLPDGIDSFQISSAKNGVGQLNGSGCTPIGQHYVRAKIGSGVPGNSVFIARRPTGEIYSAQLAQNYPDRDWILTRILWLCGTEKGVNRSGQVDSMRRYIYIHGTPDTEEMGIPLSHGCIRMRNRDIIELFDKTPLGTTVSISS